MSAATQPRGTARAAIGPRATRRRADLRTVAPDVWLIVALTAVAALLRFATLTSQSFWIDEATTVHEVGLSVGSMLHEIRLNETTPPLYFLAAWGWTHIFGSGEAGIRSLSALAGILLVPVTYMCGRELVTRRAGVAAATLASVSPLLIWYSQEARSYSLFALFSAVSVLGWARALRTGARRDVVLWGAASVLAVLTHFFAAFLVAPEALWLLWRLRSRMLVLAAAVVAAAQLSVLPLAIGDTTHPLNWITAFPLSMRIQQIPVTLGLGELYKSPEVGWGLAGAGILLAAVVALLVLGGTARERAGAAKAAALAACVILIPVAMAQAGRDYVFARNMIAAWVPLAVVIGAAATGPRRRWAGGLLAAGLLAGSVWGGLVVDSSPGYQRPDWRGVAAALGAPRGVRAIAAYSGNAAEQPLSIYLQGTGFSYSGRPASNAPVRVWEIDVVGDVEQAVPARLPSGVRSLGRVAVHNLLVARFVLERPRSLRPAQIAALAPRLLGPATAGSPAVLIQR